VNLDALPLSPRQIISIAQANARINCWTGAIRSGKTVASLLRWLIYIASAPPGELVVVAKTSQTAARNIFGPLQDYALFGELATQTEYTPGAPSGRILGRRVWVIGANDARAEGRLRGLTCAGALVDEATLVPREFFTQLLGRMSVPGSKMFLTSNPDNAAHWLRRDFLLRSGELDLAQWHFTLDDNPSLTEEYKNAIKAEFSGIWFRRFVLGEWCSGFGAIYDMWDPGEHIRDILPPIVSWLGVGIDHGTRAPFAALLLGLGVDKRLYLVDEWRWDSGQKHRQMTDVEYSKALRDWLAGIRLPASELRGVKPQFIIVDPSAANFRQQLYQDGLNPVLADNAVLDGIRLVSSVLASGKLLVARRCKGFIDEIGGYSWDDRAAALGEDKPIKADDHSLDSARYVIKTTHSLWHHRIDLAA
jgi:PBSX family phage terminase large subunit